MDSSVRANDKRLSQDFHGFRVPEFKAGVRKLLEQAQKEKVNRVTFITGKGNHSSDGAVLLHVLPNLLKKEFSGVVQEVKRDLGAYEIVLKKEQPNSLFDETIKKLSSFIYDSEMKGKLVEDANKGLTEAQYHLGTMLLEGVVFEKNEKDGLDWITKAAKTDAIAQALLGYCYEVGKSVPQNYKTSRAWYKKALKQDHPSAAFALGKFYWLGINVIRNDKKGLSLIQKAADLGHSWAAYNYGDILFQSFSTLPLDRSQAPKYLEQAAKKGVLPAQVLFAKICFFGWKSDIDDKKALFYFQAAAEAGDAIAQYYCGRCYAEGRGTPVDSFKAFKCYEASAAQGDLDAKLNVAQFLMTGRGMKKKKPLRGLQILEELAKVSHSNSVCALGIVYFYGRGPIKPDRDKALPLLIRAAHNDSLEAQLLIARLFICDKIKTVSCEQIFIWLREGVKQDDPEALYWLGLFLDQKDENKYRTEILSYFTKASDLGHQPAKLMLAMTLMEEEIAPENVPLVLQLLKETAKKNPLAQDELGRIYMLGKIVPLNEELAFAYFKKGAKQNYPTAVADLAYCYLFGKGVKQSDQLAADNFLKAAKLGDPIAQIEIAKCLLKGKGIDANPLEAASFLKKAAEQGLAEADYLLGCMYTNSSNGILAKPAQGFRLLKKAAASECKEAARLLGQLCFGKNPPRVEEGLSWLKKAALLGDLQSQGLLGTLYMESKWIKPNPDEAIKWLEMAAAQGDLATSFFLGQLLCSQLRYDEAKAYLEKGIASDSDDEEIGEMKQTSYQLLAQIYANEGNPLLAVKYYKLCPEESDVMYRLGYLYDANENLDPDKSLAINCLMKAARQNHVEAQYCLGCVLGKLAEIDSAYGEGAFQWFSTAANNGHLRASFELGCIYLKGEFGQKVELLKARELLLQPAKDGHADAQFLLGCMCTFWNGLKPKYPEGVRWFVKAAEQGHVEACFNLGYAYQMGQGIELSLSLAISWYLKSAKAGHINSQINLGVILLSMKNREEGIYWLKIAAGQESQKAKNLLKNIYLEEKEETGKLQEPFMLEQEDQLSKEKAAEPLKIEHESGAASVAEDFIHDNPRKKLESISPEESKEPTESRICSLQ